MKPFLWVVIVMIGVATGRVNGQELSPLKKDNPNGIHYVVFYDEKRCPGSEILAKDVVDDELRQARIKSLSGLNTSIMNKSGDLYLVVEINCTKHP